MPSYRRLIALARLTLGALGGRLHLLRFQWFREAAMESGAFFRLGAHL